ncbi:hypothetical protein [Bradyrhizobium sp. Ai1a-2]|uniref:portal protein n=1 Tax=Bradyrhizobium sp. Ai1a-2 TaxID=196490 RepID=UPI00041BAC85|nr:hypothetical protein [Bradyrhizobium sp. Ai1a-2]
MASPFAASVLPVARPDDEKSRLPAVSIDLGSEVPTTTVQDGAAVTELPDGSVAIDLSGRAEPATPIDDKFNANLAEKMSDGDLAQIATELLEGIGRDDESRSEHLEMLSEGIKLLGLVIETTTTTSVTSSAPLEGMSTVRHPLLLDACQLFQANANGELLPAGGPVKVRDDRPKKPKDADMLGHNGGPALNGGINPFAAAGAQGAPQQASPGSPQSPPGVGAPGSGSPPPPPAAGGPPAAAPHPAPPAAGASPGAPAPQQLPMPAMPVIPDEEEERDAVEDALEKDMNHYLTVVDKGYVADSDQMFFKTGFGGLGVKKVYHDPLKRRPLSRSINVEDFIVSKDVSDLDDAERITHRIRMPKATMRRMQIVGAYRDIDLGQPTLQSDAPNQVKQTKEEVSGVKQSTDPRDLDFEVYECYCLLDLDQFAPKQFRGKKLPLPYKVSIERTTERVLEIRRNWRKEDEECLPKQHFVDFPYMRAFGFYCIGLLHLLGNTTKALTALWREFLDAGMFANFPGFLYLKGAGRQLTNQFRVAPGSGVGIDASVEDIRAAVMALPYKNPDAAFTQFVQHVEELGQKLGGTAQTMVAEGRADAPVGTTLALIEQASKPVSAVNKRLHSSQAREFDLLKERFREDPEAFWRFNKKPAMQWEKEVFLKALEDFEMVPVADPNNPTKLHRMAKAEAYRQMVTSAPTVFDPKKAILKYADEMGIEGVEATLAPPQQPQQPPVDQAKLADVQQRHAKAQLDAQNAAQERQADIVKQQRELADNEAERQNKLQIAQIGQGTERLRLASTVAIHADDLDEAQRAANIKIASDHVAQAHGHADALERAQQQHAHRLAEGGIAHQRAQQAAGEAHERAKDMAEHNAAIAPKPEAGPVGALPKKAKPKKGNANGKKPKP